MTELTGLINEALSLPDARSGAARAKELVRNRLVQVEPRAVIYETDYFDHSFAPDLVLRQPGVPADPERWIFLRTTNEPRVLTTDLEVAAHRSMMLISLDSFRTERSEALEVLDRASVERDALVMDVPALVQIGESDQRPSTTALMTRALVASGRGLLDAGGAQTTLESFATGVEGAIEGAVGPTGAAAREVRRRLTAAGAARVTSFLGALWEGSGRSRMDFPGQLGTAGLDETSLGLLLDGPEINNDQLWRRLAGRTSLTQIADATSGSPENLQRLVKAGLGSITAHVCLIEPAGLFGADETQSWRWVVRDRRLSLVGRGFTAHIAARREDLPSIEPRRAPIGLDTVRQRARQFGIVLSEVRMRARNRTIGYDSTGGEDIVYDHELDQIGATLGDPLVAHAEAQVSGDARLSCDFWTGTTGLVAPRAQIPVGELVATAIRLLEPLDDDDAQTVMELLRPGGATLSEDGIWDRPSLFDDSSG